MNDLMCWVIPSKEAYTFVGITLGLIGLFCQNPTAWLGGIICWCAAGIMAHD